MSSCYALVVVFLFITSGLAQYGPPSSATNIRDPATSFFSALFGSGRRGPPQPPYSSGYPVDDYFDPSLMAPPIPQSRLMGGSQFGGMSGGFGSDSMIYAGLLSYINDKDNFQAQGCGFDLTRNRCEEIVKICKGGCREFGLDTHDCRCIPFTLMALLGMGK